MLAFEYLDIEFGGVPAYTFNTTGDYFFHFDFTRSHAFVGWMSEPEIVENLKAYHDWQPRLRRGGADETASLDSARPPAPTAAAAKRRCPDSAKQIHVMNSRHCRQPTQTTI